MSFQSIPIQFFPSQFPESLEAARRSSWDSGRVDGRFHYEGYRQTQRWLRLHEAFSPARTQVETRGLYDRVFKEVGSTDWVDWVSLGCGGAHKESQWIDAWLEAGRRPPPITLVDCAAPMLMEAWTRVSDSGGSPIRALSLDLGDPAELKAIGGMDFLGETPRLYSCFGVTPNVDLERLGAGLTSLLKPRDMLVINANLLESGEDRQAVLAGYDNELTREWLGGFLEDKGFAVQPDRFDVYYVEGAPHEIRVDYTLDEGASLRLFFSNRFASRDFELWLQGLGFVVRYFGVSEDRTEAVACVSIDTK